MSHVLYQLCRCSTEGSHSTVSKWIDIRVQYIFTNTFDWVRVLIADSGEISHCHRFSYCLHLSRYKHWEFSWPPGKCYSMHDMRSSFRELFCCSRLNRMWTLSEEREFSLIFNPSRNWVEDKSWPNCSQSASAMLVRDKFNTFKALWSQRADIVEMQHLLFGWQDSDPD